jgi:hypothetical protein
MSSGHDPLDVMLSRRDAIMTRSDRQSLPPLRRLDFERFASVLGDVAEVEAQRGHDLVLFITPPAVYEDQVIDHRELYEECERKYGKPIDLAIKSTYNPKTKKYYGFSDSYVPDPINYRKDLWDDVGMYPDSWDDIRTGGKKMPL